MDKQYYVYILTNKTNNVLYVGVTNDLVKRIYEHKQKLIPGFSSRYNLSKLVHFESTDNIQSAIAREKQIKGGSRKDKIELVNNNNAEWADLYGGLV